LNCRLNSGSELPVQETEAQDEGSDDEGEEDDGDTGQSEEHEVQANETALGDTENGEENDEEGDGEGDEEDDAVDISNQQSSHLTRSLQNFHLTPSSLQVQSTSMPTSTLVTPDNSPRSHYTQLVYDSLPSGSVQTPPTSPQQTQALATTTVAGRSGNGTRRIVGSNHGPEAEQLDDRKW
jgi:hypothetical protein